MVEQKVAINFERLIYRSYTASPYRASFALSSFSYCRRETNSDEEGQGNYEARKRRVVRIVSRNTFCCIVIWKLEFSQQCGKLTVDIPYGFRLSAKIPAFLNFSFRHLLCGLPAIIHEFLILSYVIEEDG